MQSLALLASHTVFLQFGASNKSKIQFHSAELFTKLSFPHTSVSCSSVSDFPAPSEKPPTVCFSWLLRENKRKRASKANAADAGCFMRLKLATSCWQSHFLKKWVLSTVCSWVNVRGTYITEAVRKVTLRGYTLRMSNHCFHPGLSSPPVSYPASFYLVHLLKGSKRMGFCELSDPWYPQ